MDVDAAAERIYEKIKSYMVESDNAELTEEEQEKILVGVIKVFIEEVGTLAVVEALNQTKIAVDGAVKAFFEEQRQHRSSDTSDPESTNTPPCRGE